MIIEKLKENADKFPDKIAFIKKGKRVTWSEFFIAVKSYSLIINNYFQKNEIVPIIGEKSILVVELFLAAMYSHHPYVYINKDCPQNRRQIILKSIKATHFIECTNDVIISIEKTKNKHTFKYKNNLAYIIFTSGSTGTPKGVKITKACIENYISNFINTFKLNDDEIFGNQSPFDFDMAMGDIYLTIMTGATLCLIDKSYFILQKDLIDFLIENKVSTIIWCVSALCSLYNYDSFSYKTPELKNIMFIGEQMPLKCLEYLKNKIPKANLVNLYGPTETTCSSSFYQITTDLETLPIGKPFNNERLFLIDDKNKIITEPNMKGEICISGSCLADGYLDKHDTKKVFKGFFKKYYKTGDIGYFDKNNLFYFINRRDGQIKFNGYRIELGEIENIFLKRLEHTTRCCCIFNKNKIKLYYTGKKYDDRIIQDHLKYDLPSYMIPKEFIWIDKFQLNQVGKIDKEGLR